MGRTIRTVGREVERGLWIHAYNISRAWVRWHDCRNTSHWVDSSRVWCPVSWFQGTVFVSRAIVPPFRGYQLAL
jgi:hypothetical protein